MSDPIRPMVIDTADIMRTQPKKPSVGFYIFTTLWFTALTGLLVLSVIHLVRAIQ